MPFVSRTRATFRRAEFGCFGVVVYTRVHTPRRCGAATFFLRPLPDLRPGVASFFLGVTRPLRISWLVVGMRLRRVAGEARQVRPVKTPYTLTPPSTSSTGTYGRPTASATGAYVTCPPATFTPSFSPGLAASAPARPADARCTT